MRIGILGGSFDPIHKGHLALAQESEKQFHLDKILFIPVRQPPHKIHTKEVVATPEERSRMIELAIQDRPSWGLSKIELQRPGVSYTVDTLRELRKIYPKDEFFFMVGADAYLDLKNWKDPEEIMKLSEWIVAPRPGAKLPAKLPPRFHLLKMELVAISASETRKKMREKNQTRDLIPANVQAYIDKRGIYSESCQ